MYALTVFPSVKSPGKQSMVLINSSTNKSDLNELLNSCEEYMLQKQSAQQIISEVLNAVKEWQSLATRLGIAKSEQERFVVVFERQVTSYDRV